MPLRKVRFNGGLTKSTGRLLNIIPEGEYSNYALRHSGGTLSKKLEGSYHKGAELIDEVKLDLRAPNGTMASFEVELPLLEKNLLF